MRKSKGFTLIELLNVVAIIAIIAAIAIPNLLQARMRSNESSAVTLLRKYYDAQQTFREQKLGSLPENSLRGGATGYADNFSLLHFGYPLTTGADGRPAPDTTRPLTLIDKEFATARDGDGVPFHGYLFAEPAGAGDADSDAAIDPRTGLAVVDPANFWANRFALIAVPSISGRTGTKAFYIDNEGVLFMKELPLEIRAADSIMMDTPLKTPSGWIAK